MFQDCPINTLPTRPQPPCNHVSNSNYAYFCVMGPNAQIWKFGPRYSNFCFFLNSRCFRIVPSMRLQRVLNDIPITLQTQIMPIFEFWAPNAQIWKFGPRSPKFCTVFENGRYFRIVPSIRFQRALNDYQKLK